MAGTYHDFLLHQHQQLGAKGKFTGYSTLPYAGFTGSLLSAYGARYVLDFGSGVGIDDNNQHLGHKEINRVSNSDITILGYEPTKSNSKLGLDINKLIPSDNNSFDASITFDVLEHLHHYDSALIVPELFRVAKNIVIANISCIPAAKKLPNGRNAHTSLLSPQTWLLMFWQESLRTGKDFALFNTVSPDRDLFCHSIPFERHVYAFSDQFFLMPSDTPAFTNRSKVSFNGNKVCSEMSPFERWRQTHISTLFSY